MSTKEERPTLAGVNVKTRKRNIVVPADPASFATAIVQIFQVLEAAAAAVSVQLQQHAGHEAAIYSNFGG
jgi:hypothetical protein